MSFTKIVKLAQKFEKKLAQDQSGVNIATRLQEAGVPDSEMAFFVDQFNKLYAAKAPESYIDQQIAMLQKHYGKGSQTTSKAPQSLPWQPSQILQLQKLMNKAKQAMSLTGLPPLKEDGVYGPQTQTMLGSLMSGLAIPDVGKLMQHLQSKFPVQ